jgi:hypothetical protein
MLVKTCNENILKAIESCKRLMELADAGDMDREDESCGVLFGMIRDSAYKIMNMAEKELQKHQQAGKWE